MPPEPDWQISDAFQPRPQDYDFDLDRALSAVVSISSMVPQDAFTAGILGTERSGNGVIIRKDGLVLTVGYLITEAEQIWLGLADGRTVPGHALAYDQETGFGLVQALAPRLDLPALPLGNSHKAEFGQKVVVGGAGGRARSVAARIVAKQEFAGYWEYVLDEALFTAPAHPYWGGTALIGPRGELLGIGSLRLEQASAGESGGQINMSIPIDLLRPILDDLLTTGTTRSPPRPWLGLYAVDVDDQVIIAGIADGGPAEKSGLRSNDVVLRVGNATVDGLAEFFRAIWALGAAGVRIPITVNRDGEVVDVTVTSGDRRSYLKAPRLH